MHTDEDCPFCKFGPERIAFDWPHGHAIWDGFPVSPGHLLIVPKRHAATWDELTADEKVSLALAIDRAQSVIQSRYSPDGFNVGFNLGKAAGQTVFHFHLHVIPRYQGDVPDPRGGVRTVIPSRGNYLATSTHERTRLSAAPHDRALITGGEDAFIRHLLPHIDDSQSIDLVVSFILDSGVRLLQPRLQDLLERGGRLRVVTGDYLDVTEPSALRRLLDLEGNVKHWVFEGGPTSFHPKAWIFYFHGRGGIAVVGSSNLSESALKSGIEWNYRLYDRSTEKGWSDVIRGFDGLLARPELRPLTHDWIDAYEERRISIERRPRDLAEVSPELPIAPVIPHAVQTRALRALKETRSVGYTAGLVVLATGLGKTWLGAFDSFESERVLFVAHREEILNQALRTFRQVRPNGKFGRYTGEQKDLTANVIFASIQTLGRAKHLRAFPPDSFEYIIVDEFHHAAARTYRALIDHFTPKFLLGLTATPERTDGGDLLGLCQENLVFRCDLFEGISENLLSPFHYFGVSDDVDYEQIPWRSTAFDETALTAALATQRRAQNAFEQFRKHGGTKAIGFCCSILHADFMADFFETRGIRSAAVHSGTNSAPRVTALEKLQAGELQIVFAVDILNEGVDIPDIDTILMLRPTESSIVWLQQFGRGLRVSDGKEILTVVDYIGNHRIFLTKARTLLNVGEGDRALALALEAVEKKEAIFPPGCEVTYELQALSLLQRLLQSTDRGDALEAFYLDFRERNGVRPTALETFHAGFDPRVTGHGGWFGFVSHMGDFSDQEGGVFGRHEEFFRALSTTQMSKSYKMIVLKAMIAAGSLPGAIALDVLVARFTAIAARNPNFRKDVSVPLTDLDKVGRLLVEQPIPAWTEGKGTGGARYFEFSKGTFSSTMSVAAELASTFSRLAEEIIDFRIGQYLGRGSHTAESAGFDPRPSSNRPFELWAEYNREEIAPLFGTSFSPGNWNAGMVLIENNLVLLMTLAKGNLASGNEYDDRFVDSQTFKWHTQSRTTQKSKHGRIIRGELADYRIHLFVRPAKLRDNTAAPFIYCGKISTIEWHDEKPISVTSRLDVQVPRRLHRTLKVGVPLIFPS